ncbi:MULTISPECIES: hypothetical protein [unclassified Lentimonas]|uniref:hypothetical protein n=1 Tax=unclassified Lentimonas TaxID=2630993 RepID=UPI00132523E2|nr:MULTISPECIES: hypothetical protein [unclassified Lentimonas]CAA6677418.1 Unannotated [Lentimonas sp. CC4]CAA6686388.1 Unannotated [Lentimonas sp. CC6]CAA7074664.1 Unannotated [Lentimonas sp. CC4]CAA7169286.1 Unannotated [Lentimonas sp. CC21]CAA7180319.1 Unannotated [Lentimonas sp. CC8]
MRSSALFLSLPFAIILAGCQSTSPQFSTVETEPVAVVEPEAELIPARVAPIPSIDTPPSEVITMVEPDVITMVEPDVIVESMEPLEPLAPVAIEESVIPVEELIVEAPVVSAEEPIVVDEFEPAVELTRGVRVMLDDLRDTVSLSAEQYYEIEQIFADRGVEYKALLKQRSSMDSSEFDQQKSQLFSRYYRLYTQVLTPKQRKAWVQRKK